jgi:hypothetical protein
VNAKTLTAAAALLGLPVLAGAAEKDLDLGHAVWCYLTPANQLTRDELKGCVPSIADQVAMRCLMPSDLTPDEVKSCAPLIREFRRRAESRKAAQAEADAKKTTSEAAGSTKKAEEQRHGARSHNDPGAISLCPPPYKMTRDGCQ